MLAKSTRLLFIILMPVLLFANIAFSLNSQITPWKNIGPSSGNFLNILSTSSNQLITFSSSGFLSSKIYHYDSKSNSWQVVNDNHVFESMVSFGGSLFANSNSAENGGGQIYRSNDGGRTWALIYSVPDNPYIAFQDLVAGGDALYALAANGALFKSNSDGSSWEQLASLPNPPANTYGKMAVEGDLIYVIGPAGQLYQSVDGGSNFSELAMPPKGVYMYDIMIMNGTVYIAGKSGFFARSSDGGKTWFTIAVDDTQNIFNQAPQPHTIAMFGNQLFFGSAHGIYKSSDNGSTWQHVYKAANLMGFNSLFSMDEGETIYAATTSEGLLNSNDGGKTWFFINSGIHNQSTTLIAEGNNSIYAIPESGNIYKLNLTTNKWMQLNFPGSSIDPLLAFGGNALYVGDDSLNIYRTDNDGQTWAKSSLPMASGGDPELFVNNNSLYYVMGGVYKSTDTGKTWVRLPNTQNFIDLAFSGKSIYATDGKVVYESSDYGDSWSQLNFQNTKQLKIQSVYAFNNILFIATGYAAEGGGIYISTDNGKTWKKSLNLDATSNMTNSKGRIFVEGYEYPLNKNSKQFLFMSDDNGASWKKLGPNLKILTVSQLFVKNNTVFSTGSGLQSANLNQE